MGPSPKSKASHWPWLLLLGAALAAVGARWLSSRAPAEPTGMEPALSGSAAAAVAAPLTGYTGSAACQSCHAAEFRAWQGSHHARAEQQISVPEDLAAFDAAAAAGHARIEFRAGSDASGPQVEAQGSAGKRESFRPKRWIGVAPLRQVLIEAAGGRLQALDIAHAPKERDWFSIFGSEARQHDEWGHWTGRGLNWNSNCAFCHNTALHKNYRAATDSYETKYQELGIGCESCHGPRQSHVQQYASGGPTGAQASVPSGRDAAGGGGGASAVGEAAQRRLDTCGACHARRSELTGEFQHGEPFGDHFSLEIPSSSGVFHADGQVNDEAYELTSFLGSRMHHAGVTCQDCHEPHSGKTRFAGNQLCLQCHEGGARGAVRIQVAGHTFHRPESAGSECVSCHMPLTSYMQRHRRRDHGFTIPDPLLTVEHGIPNACTRCHDDKPARWAAQAAERFYGARLERPSRARARAVAKARAGEPGAREELLGLLKKEPTALWRAAAAGLLERYLPDPAVKGALLEAAGDEDGLVRVHALRSLERMLPYAREGVNRTLEQALEDPLRSVRITAAWALRRELDEGSTAGQELLASLRFNQDQPSGQMQLGGYQLARGKANQAADHFQRAVSWDPKSAPLRHELAIALSQAGRAQQAIVELETALRLEPREGEYAYKLGLAHNENRDLAAAIKSFERAVELSPQHGRAWYNLGLARDHQGDPKAALRALERAEQATPRDADVPYARAIVLGKLGRKADARTAAERALSLNPGLAAARRLLQSL